MDSLISLLTVQPWLYYTAATVFGIIVGSFLNVVIYRLPVMMERGWKRECAECFPEANLTITDETFNLSVPRSRCGHCHTQVEARDNIPVISWLILGGKCRHCKTPISIRYPAVETLTGLVSLAIAIMLPPSGWSLAVMAASWTLIALTFIDADTQLLPDSITLPLLWAGIAVSVFGISPVSLSDSVVGAMAGYLSLWSVFWAFKLLTGKDGMGYGDFKLLAALGAWLGWQSLPLLILLASLTGAIFGIIQLRRAGQSTSQPFAFGPYLAIAGWVCLLWGDKIIHWYLTVYLGV
ncbi:A24 family peptidase [Parasalinivibrio latis]